MNKYILLLTFPLFFQAKELCSVRQHGYSDNIEQYYFGKMRGAVFGALAGDALGRFTEPYDVQTIFQLYPRGVKNVHDLRSGDLQYCYAGYPYLAHGSDIAFTKLFFKKLATGILYTWHEDRIMDETARAMVYDMANSSGWAALYRKPSDSCLKAGRLLEARLANKVDRRKTDWWKAGRKDDLDAGAIIRALPAGLMFAHDKEMAAHWAAHQALLTHRSSTVQAACAAFAVGIASVIRPTLSGSYAVVDAMVEAASEYDSHTALRIRHAADDAYYGVSPEIMLQGNRYSSKLLHGWTAESAIAAAVYIFVLSEQNLPSALDLALHSTGKSDTIASLAGALVGANASPIQIKEVKKSILEDMTLESLDEFENLAQAAISCYWNYTDRLFVQFGY